MISLVPFLSSLALAGEPTCQLRAPLVFTPSALNFKDTDGPKTVSITLKNAPAGPVSYLLSGKNMHFNQCMVKFDQTNWNQPQVIQMIGIPYRGKDVELNFKIDALSLDRKKVKGSIDVTRLAMKAPVASSAGDPHYELFDGNVITQHRTVVNYVFKSPDFDVMSAEDKCNPIRSLHCNKAAVIRYGKSWYTYDARTATRDGKGITVLHNGDKNPDFVYSGPNKDKKTYDFTIPDGSTVSLFPSDYTEDFGIHTTIKITLHPSMAVKGKGILNDPYAKKDVLVYADGNVGKITSETDVEKFFKSWVVPDLNNTFMSGFKPSFTEPTLASFQDCDSFNPLVKRSSSPIELNAYNGTWQNGVEKEAPVVKYTASEMSNARSTCSAMFKNLDFCKDIVSTAPFEESCYLDYLITKKITIAQDYLEDYLLECAENVLSVASVDAEIDKVMAKYGFGTTLCPKNCSNNGACTTSGCSCAAGFHGIDCSEKN